MLRSLVGESTGETEGTAHRGRPSAVWRFLWIRIAFWVGTALTLAWVPLAPQLIPPFRAYDARTDLLFGTFAQWDSQWFLRIVEKGYDAFQATAFFPVYPLFVDAAALVVRSPLVAGVLVSILAATVGAAAVYELGRRLLGERLAADSVLLLALFPTAFVFTAPQSDGLFLALSAWAFLFALRDRPWLAGLCGGLAVGTRLIGLALLPGLALALWRGRSPRDLVRLVPLLLLPLELAAHALYLHRRFGDAFAFAHAQQIFWVRHVPPLGPFGGLWDSLSEGVEGVNELFTTMPRAGVGATALPPHNQVATWNVVHALLLIAALWLTWVAWRRLGPALAVYSLASLAVVLSFTPEPFPLASFPRYLVVNFPLFLALAAVLEDRPRARQVVLFSFAAASAVAGVAFSRKIWIG